MALSEGDTIGSFCHTVSSLLISPPRSTFPTSNFFLRLQERIVGGLFLSSQRYDSVFSHLLGINYRHKPPWILHYINHSPVLFFSPVPVSFRQQSLSIMGDNLRKSVPDLTLGFVDAPIALPPAIASCTASINRFHLVVMTVNSRTQHFRALIGPRIWVWDLADVCVGRSVSPGKFQFQYRKEESMALVLHRAVWSLNDWMLNINRWLPNIIEEARTIIPFWFRLSGVRDHGYGSEFVSIFSAYKTSQNQIWVSGISNSDVRDDGVMVWPDRIKKSRLI